MSGDLGLDFECIEHRSNLNQLGVEISPFEKNKGCFDLTRCFIEQSNTRPRGVIWGLLLQS